MEFFEGFSFREAVVGIAVLLGIYSGIIIIRLSRLSKKAPSPPVWKQDPVLFGDQMLKSGIEAELKGLRDQMAALKEEMEKLKTARTVSPQYSEAVALAQQGVAAQAIAERCGISVAEAELVRALSRGRAE
jgi:hypothetical protein